MTGETMNYKLLFSRGKIGKLSLRNRIVLPPMGTNMVGTDCEANDAIIRFYQERAKGGCGLIITEISRVDDETGIGMAGQLSVTEGKYVRNLIRLTDAVHQYDSKIFLQLQHPGRTVSPKALGGKQPVGPSPIADPAVGIVPRELTTEECEGLVRKFVTGAYFAKMAGFDGVELHGAHGYLINQFLSPYSNQRTDRYGGSPEKRMTFLSEIVTGIRAYCGPDFPISVRLSVDEFVENGLKIEDSIKIAQEMERLGASAINVSAGVYESGYAIIEPQSFPEGWKKHLAAEMKKHVSIPVIAVNNIKNPETAERLLEEGVSDFVALGRAQLADPHWAKKTKEGRASEIHRCIGCLHCFGCLYRLRPIECTVNPLVGREYLFQEERLPQNGGGTCAAGASGNLRIAVIGGGPAGMQAAVTCAKRGYQVTLFEKQEKLGGTVQLAAVPPHKEMLEKLIEVQTLELEQAGVEVRLQTEADPKIVKELDPYGVILALGGRPVIPALPGIDLPQVCTAEQVLAGEVCLSDKQVVIVGGGVTGLETAQVLAKENQVTVIEMLDKVGGTLYVTNRLFLLQDLKTAGVQIQTGKRLQEVLADAVVAADTKTGEEVRIKADAVVLALGVRSLDAAAEAFEDAFDHVIRVGDVNQTGQIVDALKSAHDRAYVF